MALRWLQETQNCKVLSSIHSRPGNMFGCGIHPRRVDLEQFIRGRILKIHRHGENFDFLRLFAAGLVLLSHQFALSGRSEPIFFERMTFGSLGVCIFFSLSGFLVSQSWVRDPHPGRFMARRLLRIWPGLFAVTAVCALVLGPLTSTLPAKEYFASGETWRYFKILLFNIKYELPGVFETNPFPRAVNGSLWTIPLEVKWYLVVLLAGILWLMRFRYLVLMFALSFAFFCFAIYGVEKNPDRNYFWEYGLFFLSGVCLSFFPSLFGRRSGHAFACFVIAAGIACALARPWIGVLIILPYAAILFGLASTPVLRRAGGFGDLSYGLYIYAFPVQQLVIWSTEADIGLVPGLVLSASGALLLAFFSWHLVEKQAMRFRPKVRNTET